MHTRLTILAVLVALVASLGGPAAAHEERTATFPSNGQDVPVARQDGPSVVVCKQDSLARTAGFPAPLRTFNQALWQRCQEDGFAHIQAAVDWVRDNGEPGHRILVMPGIYREEPSLQAAQNLADKTFTDEDGETRTCQEVLEEASGDDGGQIGGPLSPGEDTGDNSRGTAVLTYRQQVACPHIHNLILVAGDAKPEDDVVECNNNLCDLQIEGTGLRAEDVTVDGDFGMLNGIRIDRADGAALRNLTVQRFEFNAVYVMETDGFLIDEVLARWNDEYAFLSFAADHGLYENCEGYGNGDSVVYPGSASDLYAAETDDESSLIPNLDFRPATEIRACRGHHSTLGYSGTAGNAVHIHHNEFDHNAGGGAMDSLFPDHPGMPQDHSLFEQNLWHENNNNYYEKYVHQDVCTGPFSDRGYDDGVVCPVVPMPVGTGTIIAGGNYNWFGQNSYYDNWRQGTFQIWVPKYLRTGQSDDPVAGSLDGTLEASGTAAETSHWNTYAANLLGSNPNRGLVQPNGFDFTWDQQGEGNCWDQSGEDANTSAADGGVTYGTYDASGGTTPRLPSSPVFPDCDSRSPVIQPAATNVAEGPCALYSRDSEPDPQGCDWFETPPVPEARQPEAATLQRLAGTDRVETAILASREAHPGHAPVAVLARMDDFADALAGAPLAAALDGPMLLTQRDRLDPRTLEELRRLGAHRVVLLGGTAAVTPAVEQALRAAGLETTRVAGPDRFATSVEIARLVGGGNAFVAKGQDADPQAAWADVLAASPAAALLQRPILLTGEDTLPEHTASFLDEGFITNVRVVGGEAAISSEVFDDISSRVRQSGRLAGPDRYRTSLAVAEYVLETNGDPTELWLATGQNWPDGIAAGPAVAVDEGIMLLTDGELDADDPVRAWLDTPPFSLGRSGDATVGAILERARILGGTAAVPAGVEESLVDDAGMQTGDARGDRSHGTRVTGGSFEPLPGAEQHGYGDVTGHAVMERRLDGTTRTRVYVEGLPTGVGTTHPVHAHAEPCSTPPGENPHYAVDTEGPVAEPNEIHPTFTVQSGGVGLGDSTVFHIAGEDVASGRDAVSVIIHTPADEGAEKMVCADLR